MGCLMRRTSAALRRARIDPALCVRCAPPRRDARTGLTLREVATAAYDAGRSCYFRPLFDRPRQWAEQRSPRPAAGQNSSDR
jgi:hypothetical protein